MVDNLRNADADLIPNEWNTSKLSEIASFENGKAHEQFIDDKGDFIVINSKFISTEGEVAKYSNRNLCPLEKGNITIVMSDIPNGKALAKCFFVDKDNRYTLNQRIGCIKPHREIDNEFVFYKLNRNKYFLSFDSGSGQTNLKKSEILECPVGLPPTKVEQTAIATAINNADALISHLEKLIAKKRAMKQGTMQELLRPKEEWTKKILGKTAILKARIGWQGLTIAEYRTTGDYYLITGTEFKNGFIDWDSCFYVDEERYKQDKNIQVKENDVLVTKDGTIGKVAFIKTMSKLATLNSGVFVIRPIDNSFIPEFFYYLLLSDIFKVFLSQLSAGSTINHLYQKDFVTFTYFTPRTSEEQKEITKILSDMDSEIEALEKKLEKYKMVKQGMMQVLLTGKIRLI